MIKIENVDVYGFEAAIRGMRNPLNSWAKSDSVTKERFCYDTEKVIDEFYIGKNDLELMKNLVVAGTDHAKFMRMITVTMDIVAPMYWWKEFDTYKIGTVRNSCSTMHTIHKKEFTLDDFSHEHLVKELKILEVVIISLNAARERYLKNKDEADWWQMIQLLPQSYNQRATVQLNYQVLRNIYHARKGHKLDEWKIFCKWIEEELPYSELITMEGLE